VEDNATVRTVFAEKQPIKRVENNITDALLYQEANEVDKELLLEDDDSGNEADSELERDTPATLDFKPIVAYFNNPQCNNPIRMMVNGWSMKILFLIILWVLMYLNL